MNTPATTSCNTEAAREAFNETFKLLGDFCTLRVIEVIGEGELRFSEIQRGLDNINPVTLTSRLKKMEEAGLIVRQVETRDKQSVAYSLSDKGRDCMPVTESIKAFSLKYPATEADRS
jgi:DNA-binding HxlR family transcriptional regulator